MFQTVIPAVTSATRVAAPVVGRAAMATGIYVGRHLAGAALGLGLGFVTVASLGGIERGYQAAGEHFKQRRIAKNNKIISAYQAGMFIDPSMS